MQHSLNSLPLPLFRTKRSGGKFAIFTDKSFQSWTPAIAKPTLRALPPEREHRQPYLLQVQSHSEATALGTKRHTKPSYFDGISRFFFTASQKPPPQKKPSILPNLINMDSLFRKATLKPTSIQAKTTYSTTNKHTSPQP